MRDIRVLCVDDNPTVCDSLELVLGLTGGFAWVGALLCADQLVEKARATRPDVVLLDLDMPGENPLAVVRVLSRECPASRVVVCSGHLGSDLVRSALDAGCWGYVTKNETTSVVVDAVRKVARGGVYLGPEVAALHHPEDLQI